MGRPNCTRSLAYCTVMASTTSAAPSISAHTATTARSSTPLATSSPPSHTAGHSSRASHPMLRVRSMAGSDAGRSAASTGRAKTDGPSSVAAKTMTTSAVGPPTTGSDRPLRRHAPVLSRRARTASTERDHATAPVASPEERRPAQSPTSVWFPVASAPCATTVPAKGTGARCRPSASPSTATSTRPRPRPPSSSSALDGGPALLGHGRPQVVVEMTTGVGDVAHPGHRARPVQETHRRVAQRDFVNRQLEIHGREPTDSPDREPDACVMLGTVEWT